VANLDATVAVYRERSEAEEDWAALEAAAQAGQVELADAALVENQAGQAVVVSRQSRHGWGKGAIVGAVVGILFPPSLLGAAAVGAGGGELIARFSRSLGRGKVKDLGETLDSGEMAIIVASDPNFTNAITNTLKKPNTVTTAPGATVEEVRQALKT
jgi:uncharacterized membrane protein